MHGSLGSREMPRLVLSAEQERAADGAAGTDLKFLLARQEVSVANQRLFYHHGVTTIEKMANIAKDREDMVKMLKEHWDLDQDASLDARVQVAAILCAYTNAQARSQRAAEVDAEHDVQEWTKPVVAGEWAAMKSALERRHGLMEDRVMPSKEYVEKKLAEVEQGEYRAEALSEVVAKEEVDPDSMIPIWDTKGRLTMKRGASKVPDPSNAEELRRRLGVMKNALELVALKHTNRNELQGDWAKVFEEYKEYLLGEYVFGLSAKDVDGNVVATPPWSLVLSYEHAVRKQAVKLVNTEGKPWVVSLKIAWKDATIKERNFTTPLALYAKRPPPPWRDNAQQSAFRKTEAKGKSKGKGKSGKGKQQGGHCATHTPEGDMICFRFNTPGEKCKAKKCKFKHVCGSCFSAKHPMFECNTKSRQDPNLDTQGSGP